MWGIAKEQVSRALMVRDQPEEVRRLFASTAAQMGEGGGGLKSSKSCSRPFPNVLYVIVSFYPHGDELPSYHTRVASFLW